MPERVLVRHLVTTVEGIGLYPLPLIQGGVVAVRRVADFSINGVLTLVEERVAIVEPDSNDEGVWFRSGMMILRGAQYQRAGRIMVEIDGHVESVLYA